MLHLRGSPAHSAFRLRKLLEGCRDRLPGLAALHAHYLHIVEHDSALTDAEYTVLERLLGYGAAPSTANRSAIELVVVPWPGTISPWSSKATDIVHNCGLDKVRCVEW